MNTEMSHATASRPEYSSRMDNFDSLLFTRHSACHVDGVPPEQISKSSPEVMNELNVIFADYQYSPHSVFGDLRDKIGSLLNEVDPLGIVEKSNPRQVDEYFPEADMLIWLHFSKNLTPRTFWALWEYQFAELNPYKNEHGKELIELLEKFNRALGKS
jgi:hypothetical protein